MNLQNSFEKCKQFIFDRYGHNPSKILVHTGVLGWILSSLAQIGAIVVNDKLSPQQKTFLIPQEAADAAVNIGSFFLVTQMFTKISRRLVRSGKCRTPMITEFFKKNDLFLRNGKKPAVGDFKFDTRYHILKSDDAETLKEYYDLKNGVGLIGTTIGTILSCNIITPILRNQIAAHQQKKILEVHDRIYNTYYQKNKEKQNLQIPRGITIDQYQNMAYRHFNSGLKV